MADSPTRDPPLDQIHIEERKYRMSYKKTLLAALAGIGLVSTAHAQTGGTITIGVPTGLSGANSIVAPSAIQSAQLAVKQINASGGVLGRKLVLDVADDESGAAGAQKAFDYLIYQKNVDAIISMETSAARNAGLPIVVRGDVPYVYTAFYEGHSCSPNLFVDGWVPEQQVPPVANYFMKTLGAKKFFLIGSDYAFGRGVLDFTKAYIEKAGGTVVGEEFLPMNATDWTAIISNLKSSGADAIITTTAGGAPNVTLTKQLRQAGVNLPYGNLALDEGTAKSMGADAAGIYISASYLTSIPSKANKAYIAAMTKMFGTALHTPNDLSVPEYDGVYLYAAAVKKAGTTNTAAVDKALGEVSFVGPRGTVSMDNEHHAPLTMYLGQVQADGSVKVIRSFASVDPGNQCPNL
jgi:branched-chain amino acid transport system substrate-binding protein